MVSSENLKGRRCMTEKRMTSTGGLELYHIDVSIDRSKPHSVTHFSL
jgi:hypothetical protein